MIRPKFQFSADSTEPGVLSGTATWTYTVIQRRDTVEKQLSVHFETFADAHNMDALLAYTFAAGIQHGNENFIHAIETTMQGFRTS
jgi:hypothetical protein